MYILLYSMVNRYCFVSCIQYILPLKNRAQYVKAEGRMIMLQKEPV